MFVTGLFIYLIATTALELQGGIIIAALLADAIAWASVSTMVEAWATGTTSDQKFWED